MCVLGPNAAAGPAFSLCARTGACQSAGRSTRRKRRPWISSRESNERGSTNSTSCDATTCGDSPRSSRRAGISLLFMAARASSRLVAAIGVEKRKRSAVGLKTARPSRWSKTRWPIAGCRSAPRSLREIFATQNGALGSSDSSESCASARRGTMSSTLVGDKSELSALTDSGVEVRVGSNSLATALSRRTVAGYR